LNAIQEPSEATRELVPERGMRMLHIEHPERIGEAWCGAPVLGVRGRFGAVDCVVCADLRRARDRQRRGEG
jgi:hypothetical protein